MTEKPHAKLLPPAPQKTSMFDNDFDPETIVVKLLNGRDPYTLNNAEWIRLRWMCCKFDRQDKPGFQSISLRNYLALPTMYKIQSLIDSARSYQVSARKKQLTNFFHSLSSDTNLVKKTLSNLMSQNVISQSTLLTIANALKAFPDEKKYQTNELFWNLLAPFDFKWVLTNTPNQILRLLDNLINLETLVLYSCPDFSGEFVDNTKIKWKYDLKGRVGNQLGFMGKKTVDTLREIVPTLKSSWALQTVNVILPSYECPQNQTQQEYISNVRQTGNLIVKSITEVLQENNLLSDVRFYLSNEIYTDQELDQLTQNFADEGIFQQFMKDPELSWKYFQTIQKRADSGYLDPGKQIIAYLAEGVLLERKYSNQQYGKTVYLTSESPLIPAFVLEAQEKLGYACLPTAIITSKSTTY